MGVMDVTALANFALVLLFVLIGGLFAGTEMAIVNLRESQIQRLEDSGPRGARTAALVRNPNLFLSAVQIGVTVAGFFSSAYGASTIAPSLEGPLTELGLSEGAASLTAVIGMTLVIAYLSLVLGELAPKRLAMQNALAVTRIVGPPLILFGRLMRPVIWLLSASTNAVVRLVGGDPNANREAVSAEEIRSMVANSEALEELDRAVLQDVFDAAERTVEEVMRPRPQVQFLEAALTVEKARHEVRTLPHSRYPLAGEDTDDVVGFVHVRDLLHVEDPGQTTVATLARPLAGIPGTVDVLRALQRMRAEGDQMALVVDEYGGTDGIVTLEDLLEELVGDIYDEYDRVRSPQDATRRSGEDIEVDGGLILQELEQETGVALPDDGTYQTVGGFLMAALGRIPADGDVVTSGQHRIEVVSMDGRRVDRVRLHRVTERGT